METHAIAKQCFVASKLLAEEFWYEFRVSKPAMQGPEQAVRLFLKVPCCSCTIPQNSTEIFKAPTLPNNVEVAVLYLGQTLASWLRVFGAPGFCRSLTLYPCFHVL